MSSSPLNVYGVVFSHWRHVQKQLTQTIQDYVDACAALKTALEVFPVDHSSRHQRAEVFSSFDPQLAVLPSYEQTLREARFSLRTMRNTSDSLIPISSLPIEILSTIFILVVQKGKNEICNLTLVCKLWRRTTLQTPDCWSQIEIPIGPDDYPAYDRVDLWAERAQSQPLCLSIWERPHLQEELNYGEDEVDYAADCLVSLLPRVHTAEFQADGMEMDDLVPEILGSWVQRGSAGVAAALKIHIRPERNTVQLSTEHNSIERYGPTPDYYKTFFGSLHTLVLENAKLDWKLGFYSGPVDLYLGPVSQFNPHNQWDIAAILKASPKLRSLALVDIEIRIDRNNCDFDLEDLQLLLSIRPLQRLWIQEPEWDASVQERAEEEAGRYGVKLTIVQNEQELPIWSRELVTAPFVR